MPRSWDEVAALRRDQIESGLDITFSRVFVPYFAGLLSRRKPKFVLEIGGGTGHLAKELVRYCERYVMLEPSRGMCEVARATLSNTGVELHNCSIEELTSEQEFDCVLSHLCLQGIPDLLSFVHAMASKLSDKGTLVASLPHPAFYNDYKKFFPESSFRYKTKSGPWSALTSPWIHIGRLKVFLITIGRFRHTSRHSRM